MPPCIASLHRAIPQPLCFLFLCRLEKREKMHKVDNIVSLENIIVNNTCEKVGKENLVSIRLCRL
jgi:hypothetical protein